MLKKTITFTNFNEERETEDFYFHLSEADLAEMQLRHAGGLDKYMERIVRENDANAIMDFFTMLLEKSYGKRSDDGKRFIKTPELWAEFKSSEAYSELYMELVTDASAGAEFFNGIIPRDKIERRVAANPDQFSPTAMPEVDPKIKAAREAAGIRDATPAAQPEPLGTAAAGPRQLTRQEVLEMDDAELKHLLATGQAVIGQS